MQNGGGLNKTGELKRLKKLKTEGGKIKKTDSEVTAAVMIERTVEVMGNQWK